MCRKCSLVGCLLLAVGFTAWSEDKYKPNDLIYPPAVAARPYIDFDGAGFTVNGQRTFLSSGSIHYPRVPSQLWRDRLLRLKQANFAAVETYTFWNYHEPRQGEFDFSGEKDFGVFLNTAQKLGLYATVRVGPYVCAEWDSGGYPLWLRFEPPFNVREDNPEWLKWNDHWYEKVLPIVAKHQVNRGGNVVMVQLENEHPHGWGVVTNNPYFDHVNSVAEKLGLEVPHFMSGQHHGASPAPANLDPAKRANPWITTEFWAGWYNVYGPLSQARNREIESTVWTIIAHGGGGYNFYMLHGGTDFDAWNNDEVGASYDDGAVIGQAGDLRPMYYRMKRQNQLAQSFPDIFANGNDALQNFPDLAAGPGVQILGARQSQSGAGAFIFVKNSKTNETTTATFKSGGALTLPPSGVYPLPHDVALTSQIKLAAATLPVLGLARNGQAVTIVVYGPTGESGRLLLSAAGDIPAGSLRSSSPNITANLTAGNAVALNVIIPTNGVAEFNLNQPKNRVRVLAVNDALSLYTWILGAAGRQYVVFGPAFVQGVQAHGRDLSVILERPYGQPACGQVEVFGGPGQSWHLDAKSNLSLDSQPAPKLAPWKMWQTPENLPAFDDSNWKHSPAPLQMGADGDISAFAWYRTRIDLPAPGAGTLRFQGADNLEVFVNSRPVACVNGKAQADFVAGSNTIAVFTSHHGRNKDFNYLGTLDQRDNKGLWGSPTLQFRGETNNLAGWAMRGGVESDLKAIKKWGPLEDSHGAPAFYQSTFAATPPGALGAHPILRVNYQGLTRGTLWINGHNLGRYPEKIKIDSLYIPECWLKSGQNVLTIFDETGANPSQVGLVMETAAGREVILASEQIDPATPIVVPSQL